MQKCEFNYTKTMKVSQSDPLSIIKEVFTFDQLLIILCNDFAMVKVPQKNAFTLMINAGKKLLVLRNQIAFLTDKKNI